MTTPRRHTHARAENECSWCDERDSLRLVRKQQPGLLASLVPVWNFSALMGMLLVDAVQVTVWSALLAIGRHRLPAFLPVIPPTAMQSPRAPRRPSVSAATAKGVTDSIAPVGPPDIGKPSGVPILATSTDVAPTEQRETLVRKFQQQHKFPRELAERIVDQHLASRVPVGSQP